MNAESLCALLVRCNVGFGVGSRLRGWQRLRGTDRDPDPGGGPGRHEPRADPRPERTGYPVADTSEQRVAGDQLDQCQVAGLRRWIACHSYLCVAEHGIRASVSRSSALPELWVFSSRVTVRGFG